MDEDRPGEKRLFRLSDASGNMTFTEIAKGSACKRNLLDSKDVFILDTGAEVFKKMIGDRLHCF